MAKQYYLVFGDDGHGMHTAGKETPYLKELKRKIKENEFNSAVVKLMKPMFESIDVIFIETAPTDYDVPLITRTNEANRIYREYCNKYGSANVHAVFISVHYNAMSFTLRESGAQGHSVHVYPGKREGRKLAECILNQLKKGTKQVNRGIVEQNLHITRETIMPAILSENGFMDYHDEALLMLDKDFQREVAEEHFLGVCDYFGLNVKGAPKPAKESKPAAKPSTGSSSSSSSLAGKRVESIYAGTDGLNFYSKASWDDKHKAGVFMKGSGWTIVKSLKVDGADMYQVKNSKGAIYYITASPKYVKVEGSAAKAPAAPKQESNSGIKVAGYIQIVNVANAAIICDSPSSTKSKDLGTAAKGSKLPIAGSVPGWFEVIYKGKRAYVNAKYAKRV